MTVDWKVRNWWAQAMLLAAVNYVAGRIGLLFALPYGFASAVFPPPGIALVAVLVFGPWIWRGVFLGSFLFNLEIALRGDAPLWVCILLAATIAAGSSAQAVIGGALVRRQIGDSLALVRGRHVLHFLAWGGAVSCLVSASIGVGALSATGVLPISDAPQQWFTWWLGDVLGVVVFAPLALAVLARPRRIWRRRVLTVAIPLLIAFLLSSAVYGYAHLREQQRAQQEFQARVNVLERFIQGIVQANELVLHSIVRYFDASEEVLNDEFVRFVRDVPQRSPGVQALEWAPRVPRAQRAAFESAAQSDHPGYEIREREHTGALVRAAIRDTHYPVRYLEPLAGNEAARGFDLASSAVYLEALTRALAEETLAATAPVHLSQHGGAGPAVLMFAPVTGSGAEAAGVAVGVFNMAPSVHEALGSLGADNPVIRITDITQRPYVPVFSQEFDGSPLHEVHVETRSLAVGGRMWRLQFWPRGTSPLVYRQLALWVLQAGMVGFTGLLGVFLLVITGAKDKTDRAVRARTRELAESNDQLQQSNEELQRFSYAVSHDLKGPLITIRGFLDLLATDLDSGQAERSRKDMRFIREAVDRMHRLLEELLQLSRVGRLVNEHESVSVTWIAQDAANMVRGAIEDGAIELMIPEDLPAIHCDRERMVQVLQNLIQNAAKYMGDQPKPRIVVGAEAGTAGVTCHVRDNGIGIAPEEHDRVFGLFDQLDPSAEGTGLGLALVQRIVEAHGGRVWLESVGAGNGSTFYFWLPTAPTTGSGDDTTIIEPVTP